MNFGELSRKDKIKLIYAYIVMPILMILSAGGQVMSELHSKYGYEAARKVASDVEFVLGLIPYFSLIFPSTIIRFVCFRRDLKYGEEIYGSLVLSLFLTTVLWYFLTGLVTATGLFETLAVYSVLSFGSRRMNTLPRMHRYILTLITLAVPFLILYAQNSSTSQPQQVYFPLWEAIVLSVVLNSYVYNPSTAGNAGSSTQQGSQSSQSNSQGTSYRFEEASSKTQEPSETPEQRLMSIGLASIGRKTKMMNKYMTAERIESRRRIEYPFLKLIVDEYQDEKQRKILSRHFMLFKEMCLFISLGVILRDKKREHEQVKTDLTNRLSDGLTVKARDWRDGYWRILTKKFYDSYTESQDIGQSLSQSFWGGLSMKYPDVFIAEETVIQSAGRLNEIFRYIYGSMMNEHEYSDI